MSQALQRAGKSTRKPRREVLGSDDSDTLREAISEAERRQEEKRALKDKRAEYASIKKKLDEQCAINARQLKALAEKRNEYPVILFIKINCSVTHCNYCVLAE